MPPLPSPKTGPELLDLYYHDMRSHAIELAAALDRLDRAGAAAEPRLRRLRQAMAIAVGDQPDRARRFLELLSV